MPPNNSLPPRIPQRNVAPSPLPLPRKAARELRRSQTDLLEPGEELITVVYRHPIGIIGYYLEAFSGLILIVGFLAFLIANFAGPSDSNAAASIIVGGSIFAFAILVFFLFVATYVYRQCRLLVTDRSLVQILQHSLFIRKVSRLSLSNVEDVSAESRGILASIFGYGTLLIQTAGAMDNFEFSKCPNPTFYADRIIEARQRYAQSIQEENEVNLSDHLMRGRS